MNRTFATLVLSALFVPCTQLIAQPVKVVIMGSSTATGTGATPFNSWADKLKAFYNKNVVDGKDTLFYNIAQPGSDTYREMPTGYPTPPGFFTPDPNFNVTKAVSFHPDIVIINLPSNDMYNNIPKAVTMNNFRIMRQVILAANARCFISTTQPRNDFQNPAYFGYQRDLVDSISETFGYYAVNFWDDLVMTDGSNRLRPEVRDGNSDYHINDLGHNYLFERLMVKNIFALSNAPLAATVTNFTASLQANSVAVSWQTEDEEATTKFVIEKSADARQFSSIQEIDGKRTAGRCHYSYNDLQPFNGKNYYRLKTIELGKVTYSPVVVVSNKQGGIAINKLYSSPSQQIKAVVHSAKRQSVNVSIINEAGIVCYQRMLKLESTNTTLSIDLPSVSRGVYFMVIDGDARVSKSFVR